MKDIKQKLLIIICFISLNIQAQENNLYEKEFLAYSEYLLNQFGIKCLSPKEFSEMGQYFELWKVSPDPAKHIGNAYGPLFLSPNKDCLIMYSARPHYMTKKDIEIAKTYAIIERVLNNDTTNIERDPGKREIYPRSQITGEITTALGLYYHPQSPLNTDSAQFNFNDFVTIISGKKAKEIFNADSIYIYDLPNADSGYFFDEKLEKLRKRNYSDCTGVFVFKNRRAVMEVKLLFTEKGRMKKNDYIENLSNQIWYIENFLHD